MGRECSTWRNLPWVSPTRWLGESGVPAPDGGLRACAAPASGRRTPRPRSPGNPARDIDIRGGGARRAARRFAFRLLKGLAALLNRVSDIACIIETATGLRDIRNHILWNPSRISLPAHVWPHRLQSQDGLRTLAMTLAAEAPDMDVFWGFRGPVAGFEHHRGITHTFLGAPFVALAVTAVVWLWHRSRRKQPILPPRWALLWLLSLLAVLSHIFLDWTNNYGVRPFFPLIRAGTRWTSPSSSSRSSSPLCCSALVAGNLRHGGPGDRRRQAIVPRTRLGHRRDGTGWDRPGSAAVEHHRALHLISNTQFGNQPTLRAGAEPYPVNPFHWFAVAETAGYYQTGSVNTGAKR